MEEIKKYKGSIPMAGGLYPASGGEYPLINTALIEKDSVSGQRLDKYLEEYPYPFVYIGTATNKEALDSLLPETEDSDNRSFIAFNKGEQVYYARSPITKEWTVCSASISEIANSVEGASLIGIGDDVNEFIDISSIKAYINTGEEDDKYQLIEKQDLMSDDTFSKEEKNKIKSALGVESGIRVSDTQPDGNNEMIDVWINTSEEEETVELVSKSDLQDSNYFTENQKGLVREAIGVVGIEDIAQELVNRDDKIPSSFAVKDVTDNLNLRLTSAEEKIKQGLDEEEITKNAVSATKKWLDENPEATTTVQDSSLTELKFTDDLKKKTIKDYVTPEMFGAVGDGVNDDTNAIRQALENSNYVFLPEGTYRITDKIQIPQGKMLFGTGTNSIIYVTTANDGLWLGADSFVRDIGFTVHSLSANGAVFRISDETLSGFYSSSAFVNINIENINIKYTGDYTQEQFKETSVFQISCEQNFGVENISGFYGVNVNNIVVKSFYERNVGYFIKTFCRNDKWVTGCTFSDCSTIGLRWTLLSAETDSNLRDSTITSSLDQLTLRRIQHQCTTNTRGFVFIRSNQRVQLMDCEPWDWFYQDEEIYRYHPYCITYEDYIGDYNKLNIVPRSEIHHYLILSETGTWTQSDYNSLGFLARYTTDRIPADLLPRTLVLGGYENNKCCCIYTHTRTIDHELHVSFKHINGKYITEYSIDFSNLHNGGTPSITISNGRNSGLKFGYTTIDDQLRVYVWREIRFIYDVLLSNGLPNNVYNWSGVGGVHGYANTINTFKLPLSERYLAEPPEGIVEITKYNFRPVFIERSDGSVAKLMVGDEIKDESGNGTGEYNIIAKIAQYES